MDKKSHVDQQLLSILEQYVGPTAQRFLERHTESHLHKPANKLVPDDLPELITWIKLSMAVISDDELTLKALDRDISQLYET